MSTARQRLRRHAAHGTLSDGQRGPTHSRGPRYGGYPPPDGFAGHIPRHGRLLDDSHFVRRAVDPAVGRSGEDCCPVLVVLGRSCRPFACLALQGRRVVGEGWHSPCAMASRSRISNVRLTSIPAVRSTSTPAVHFAPIAVVP